MKTRTSFRAGVETLESRLNLSHAHTPLHAAAAQVAAVAVRGAGSAVAVSPTTSAAGYSSVALTYGTAGGLGSYSGYGYAVVAPNLQVNITGVATLASGDQVDVVIYGSLANARHVGNTYTGKLRVLVTGGTGAFAGATGNGIVTGTTDLSSFSAQYTFTGRVRP